MADFTLDTSGSVGNWGKRASTHEKIIFTSWSDLDPFTQGYIEAMAANTAKRPAVALFAFSDLAPDTLARVLRDCEAWRKDYDPSDGADAFDGAMLWGTRNRGEWADVGFPPLAPYLGDDGKVYLREAVHAS